MKKLTGCLLIVAIVLSLCGCAAAPAPAATEVQDTTVETAAPEVPDETQAPAEDPMAKYRTGTPWLCSDLEGVITGDTPADLKDDFALHVNRDFYINAQVPEGYYSTGTVSDLSIINAQDLTRLFEDGNDFSDHDSRLVKDYYDLLMDWDARNAAGVTPLKTETDVIEAMTTLEDLIVYLREYDAVAQLAAPFTVFIDTDLNNPEMYVPYVTSGDLFLKDSAEYSKRTDLGSRYESAYRGLVTAILEKLGYSDQRAQEMWGEAFRLEELMAPHIHTNDDAQKPDFVTKYNNPMTRAEVLELQGAMPIVESVEQSSGFGRMENWLIMNPGFLKAMQTIFTEENLPLLKSWMICHAAFDYSDLLDRDCYELRKAANYAITGTAARPYEVVAAQAVMQSLIWQVSHMYCDRFFTQQDKDTVQGIIDDVIATYKEMLLSEDFISAETKALAVEKLDAIRVRNLYPDDWSAYTDPGLTFRGPAEGGSLTEAKNAVTASYLRRLQEKVKHPVNHELWADDITPITVNCFYNAYENSINILAAFCRGEVYAAGMSFEEICGKMGVVVGHEITHAFDAGGSQFDANGAFRDWWTAEDRALFNEKNDRIAAYYSGMTLWDGEPVNGDIKTTEACADMGAIKCMLTMAASREDFDYDAFFRSYANLWQTKNVMYLVEMYQRDSHSLGYTRVNSVLQQFDEFLDFYGITEGDGMYLAPEDRVAIW